jgi:hypothetical protein
VIVAQDVRNKQKKTLTEIEVQTVTFIETKNNLSDWVCDLGWKVGGIPKIMSKEVSRALFDFVDYIQRRSTILQFVEFQ